jgi:hypothetical protein
VAFLGAVATASVLFDVLFWSAGFLRMGTTSIVSHYHGAGDRGNCSAALYRSLLLAAAIGLVILLARGPLSHYGFLLVGGTQDVQFWGQDFPLPWPGAEGRSYFCTGGDGRRCHSEGQRDWIHFCRPVQRNDSMGA